MTAVSAISVFIENPAGTAFKHCFDEKRRVLESVRAVSRPYPYHYGFVLNTNAADGDNLDCFVLTQRKLATAAIKSALSEFVSHVFDHIEGKTVQPGRFLDANVALRHLTACQGQKR
jgi:inorganic pyrophosphatase